MMIGREKKVPNYTQPWGLANMQYTMVSKFPTTGEMPRKGTQGTQIDWADYF